MASERLIEHQLPLWHETAVEEVTEEVIGDIIEVEAALPPLSDGISAVFENAKNHAGRREVDDMHVLLGIMEEGSAYHVFSAFHITIEDAEYHAGYIRRYRGKNEIIYEAPPAPKRETTEEVLPVNKAITYRRKHGFFGPTVAVPISFPDYETFKDGSNGSNGNSDKAGKTTDQKASPVPTIEELTPTQHLEKVKKRAQEIAAFNNAQEASPVHLLQALIEDNRYHATKLLKMIVAERFMGVPGENGGTLYMGVKVPFSLEGFRMAVNKLNDPKNYAHVVAGKAASDMLENPDAAALYLKLSEAIRKGVFPSIHHGNSQELTFINTVLTDDTVPNQLKTQIQTQLENFTNAIRAEQAKSAQKQLTTSND